MGGLGLRRTGSNDVLGRVDGGKTCPLVHFGRLRVCYIRGFDTTTAA